MTDSKFYDDLWAGEWRELPTHGPLSNVRQRLVRKELKSFLRTDGRLLDVGCGDGTFLANLLRRHPKLDAHGIDFSPSARQTTPAVLQGRIKVGSVLELEKHYDPGSFDAVMSCEVLEHVEDPGLVLRGIATILRPGGLAVFTVPLGMHHWSSLDEAGAHYRRFELNEFSQLVTDSGLRVDRNYGWGGPFALPYYSLTKRMGARQVATTAQSRWARMASRLAQIAFHVDDLFPNPYGFQLITRATRHA
jgi:SAM-dependent methyltransferase